MLHVLSCPPTAYNWDAWFSAGCWVTTAAPSVPCADTHVGLRRLLWQRSEGGSAVKDCVKGYVLVFLLTRLLQSHFGAFQLLYWRESKKLSPPAPLQPVTILKSLSRILSVIFFFPPGCRDCFITPHMTIFVCFKTLFCPSLNMTQFYPVLFEIKNREPQDI